MLPEDLPFRVVRTDGHDEILVRAANLHIGRAAYETAIQYRDGAWIIERSDRERS